MTQAHIYKVTKNRFFIDGIRVSAVRWSDSREKSERIRTQFRYANGTIGARIIAPAREIQREIIREVEAPAPKPSRFLIRGIGRPKSRPDARTPDLVSDHFVETTERVGNLFTQEEMLNDKYEDWVHFDTFIEEVET